MEKKFKILIIVALIIIIGLGSYFAYTSYANAEFDKNLKEAHDYSKMRVDKSDNIQSLPERPNINQTNDAINSIKKIDKALDEEINSLEKAKNYAQTPEEKKYVDYQLKLKNNYKKWYEKYNNGLNNYKDVINGLKPDDIGFNEANKINKELNELNKESEKIIDNIRELLIKNPQLKDKLESFNFEDSYIGETNTV